MPFSIVASPLFAEYVESSCGLPGHICVIYEVELVILSVACLRPSPHGWMAHRFWLRGNGGVVDLIRALVTAGAGVESEGLNQRGFVTCAMMLGHNVVYDNDAGIRVMPRAGAVRRRSISVAGAGQVERKYDDDYRVVIHTAHDDAAAAETRALCDSIALECDEFDDIGTRHIICSGFYKDEPLGHVVLEMHRDLSDGMGDGAEINIIIADDIDTRLLTAVRRYMRIKSRKCALGAMGYAISMGLDFMSMAKDEESNVWYAAMKMGAGATRRHSI